MFHKIQEGKKKMIPYKRLLIVSVIMLTFSIFVYIDYNNWKNSVWNYEELIIEARRDINSHVAAREWIMQDNPAIYNWIFELVAFPIGILSFASLILWMIIYVRHGGSRENKKLDTFIK